MHDMDDIKDLLNAINTKLELHISDHEKTAPQVEELLILLQRFKGAFIMFRLAIYLAAPVTAFFAWLKDHIRF